MVRRGAPAGLVLEGLMRLSINAAVTTGRFCHIAAVSSSPLHVRIENQGGGKSAVQGTLMTPIR